MPTWHSKHAANVICDECGQVFIHLNESIPEAIDAAKARGWQERKIDDEYRYFCSFCVDFKVGA